MKKDKRFYMIGNAHLDPVWLWNWQEGFQETKATFRSALDRMKEYEDFIFTSSSAVNYEWVEKNDPEMFKEIQQRIKEGRWKLMGGWWTQPDCNIPSGESFVRQGLYGQRYFKEKFGVTSTVGYNVDSFGHNGMLPQILKKSGMDSYVMMRPMPNEKGLPNRLFWWESDDGSQVMTFRIMYEYLSWEKEIDKYVMRNLDEYEGDVKDLMIFYGVGNHGGGPTKENIESIQRLQENPELPKLTFSSPDVFFENIRRKETRLPVVHDDLLHHASGCYSAHSDIKKLNRMAENKLITAEKFAILAKHIVGQEYPKAELDRAWKNVLFNQFHDILAGTSIVSAYFNSRNELGEAIAIADRALNYAIQAISWKINIEEDITMIPLVVFNPHVWENTTNVEIELGGIKDSAIIVDSEGNQVDIQKIQSEATADGRVRLCFNATLPPLGYQVYKVFKETSQRKILNEVKTSSFILENENFKVIFDEKTGWIRSLYDKKENYEVFKGMAAKPVVIEDKTDTWSHDTLAFNKVIGDFKAKKVYVAEEGAVKKVIRVISEYNNSQLTQDFSLYKDLDYIDVKVTVNWQEKQKMLKLIFPVNQIFRKNTYEIPYGTKMRANDGNEQPGQTWIDITGERPNQDGLYGLALANDAKYSYSIDNNELGLTILRSPIYAHHDPKIPSEEEQYVYTDQGIQTFNYRLIPHKDGWRTANVPNLAYDLNVKPISVFETFHVGPLPLKQSYISVSTSNVIISAVKKAEDDQDLIVRAYESKGHGCTVNFTLFDGQVEYEANFEPNEIKTFKISLENLEITEKNLLEW